MEQKKIQEPEWDPQVKQTTLMASPIHIGKAQEEKKKHKMRSQNWTPLFFWAGPPHDSGMYFPLLAK